MDISECICKYCSFEINISLVRNIWGKYILYTLVHLYIEVKPFMQLLSYLSYSSSHFSGQQPVSVV